MANLEGRIEELKHLLAECNNEKRLLREQHSRNQDVWNQEDNSHRVDIERLNVRISGQDRRLAEVEERENHLRDQLREAIRLHQESEDNQQQLQREITRLGTSEGVALHRLIAAQEENFDLQEQIRASEEQLASLLGNPVAEATPVEELEATPVGEEAFATAVPPNYLPFLQEATAEPVESEGSVSMPDVPTHEILMGENLDIPFGATAEEARERILARATRRRSAQSTISPQERGRQSAHAANVGFVARRRNRTPSPRARAQSPISPQQSGRFGGGRKRRKKRTRKKRKRKKTRRRRKKTRRKRRRRRKNTKKKHRRR